MYFKGNDAMHDIFTLHIKLITYNITYCIILPIIYLAHNPRLRKPVPRKKIGLNNNHNIEAEEIKTIFKGMPKSQPTISLVEFSATKLL